jgi:flagellar hook-associated protein 2
MSTSASGTALIQGTSYTSGAGIDVTSTVSAIITGLQAPESAWKSDQTTITAQEAALATLQTEIATLSSSFQDLSDFDGVFSGVNATSSNSSAVSATTTTSAVSGTHRITIANLATTGVSYSNAQPASAPIAAGTLVFKLGSAAAQTVTIPGDTVTASDGTTSTSATTTLAAEAAYINKQNLGINATIVTDSTGSRLSLTSAATGSAASISVISTPLTFSATTVGMSNLTSSDGTITAGNLQFTVDGGPTQIISIPTDGTSTPSTDSDGNPITIPSTTNTMAAAAACINSKNAGITASVVTDSTGSRLMLIATAAGSSISVVSTPAGQSFANVPVVQNNSAASATGSMAAGAIVFTVGTDPTEHVITVPGSNAPDGSTSPTTTMASAAAYINTQNAGVTASVVTDTNGASRLSLTSTTPGSSVSVVPPPGGQTFSNVAGTDANLTVDGVPLVSSTNKLSTAITGVTLNLTGTSASEVELDVGPDTTKITTALNSFITAYNAAIADLNGQFQYSAGGTAGTLEEDSAARLTQAQLLSSMSAVTNDNATFKTLGTLGITMGDDGTLSLDSTTFASALDNNYSDVQSYFQSTDSTSFAQNFSTMMLEMTDMSNSPIVLDVNSLKNSYTDDQNNIDDLEATLAVQRTTLTSKYATLDALLKTFPSEMDQINTELGYKTTTSGS